VTARPAGEGADPIARSLLRQLIEDDPVEHAARDRLAGSDHDPTARDHGVDPPIVVEGYEVGVEAGGDPALALQAGRVGDVGGDNAQGVGRRETPSTIRRRQVACRALSGM
jgi:hypothetical protein